MFKKINPIDLLVILFLLCVIVPMPFIIRNVINNPKRDIELGWRPPISMTDKQYQYHMEKERELEKLKSQRDRLLKEHPRLNKYFGKEQLR